MSVADRIKSRRLALQLSQEELAQKLGYKSKSSINKIELGKQNLTQTKIKAIADALETTPSYIMCWDDDPYDWNNDPENRADQIPLSYLEGTNGDVRQAWKVMQAVDQDAREEDLSASVPSLTLIQSVKRVPILGRVAAGVPMLAEENIEGYTITDFNDDENYYALRVHGDSMNAVGINDGDLVIIRQQSAVDDGQIAVVLVNGNDATIKYIKQEGNLVFLTPKSYNPQHQIQVYNLNETPVRIIGRVVSCQRYY